MKNTNNGMVSWYLKQYRLTMKIPNFWKGNQWKPANMYHTTTRNVVLPSFWSSDIPQGEVEDPWLLYIGT